MKRALLSAAAMAILAAGQALAADLPQPMPPPQAPVAYVPTVAPVYNWGGIYFGVNGGYGLGTSSWILPSGVAISNFSPDGALLGATLGANFQTEALVFGIEGDFDGSWMDGKNSVCGVPQCETKNTWLSTLRGRVGYAADRVLFYATAGGAFGNIQANTGPTAVSTTLQNSTEMGWTAGAGIETAFADNWTARVEYLFVDLSNASQTSPAGPTTVKFNANLIRAGVDFKFR